MIPTHATLFTGIALSSSPSHLNGRPEPLVRRAATIAMPGAAPLADRANHHDGLYPSLTTSTLNNSTTITAAQTKRPRAGPSSPSSSPVLSTRQRIGRPQLLVARPVAPPRAAKRARADSPPPSVRRAHVNTNSNSIAFPTSGEENAMPAPVRKRGRVSSLLNAIVEEIDERRDEASGTIRPQRRSRRQRLYARKFPARSFIPRLDSITELDAELEAAAIIPPILSLCTINTDAAVRGCQPRSPTLRLFDAAVHILRCGIHA